MTIMRKLADALNQIRAEKGLSITAFSEELGISRSCMQMLLSGKANPRVDTLEYLVKRLDLDMGDLIPQGEKALAPYPEQWKRVCDHLKQILQILGEDYDRYNL